LKGNPSTPPLVFKERRGGVKASGTMQKDVTESLPDLGN
jgi:hypothetical protein